MKKRLLLTILLSLVLLFESLAPAPAYAAEKLAKLTINNKNGYSILVTLVGPRRVSLMAPAGKTVIEVPDGSYNVNYANCGRNLSVELAVENKAALTLPKCRKIIISFTNNTPNPATVKLWSTRYSSSGVIPGYPPSKSKFGFGQAKNFKVFEDYYYYSVSATCPNGTVYVSILGDYNSRTKPGFKGWYKMVGLTGSIPAQANTNFKITCSNPTNKKQ